MRYRDVGGMAALQSIGTAAGSLRRNPILFVVAMAFSLVQLPSLFAQAVGPLVGGIVSLVFSGVTVFVIPFFLGGVLGMANEAIDGRTSLGTLVSEGKSHYVSLLVVYFSLLVVNLVLSFVGGFAAVFVGLAVLGSGIELGTVGLAILAIVVLAVVLTYLAVAFVVQFFGHAIVIDDLGAVDGVKRSVACVRNNLVSVFGYSVIVGLGGLVAGVFGGVASLLLTPSLRHQGTAVAGAGSGAPAASAFSSLPAIGVVGMVAVAVGLVLVSGLIGGFFAAYSTAFYRSIRPTDPETTTP
ncbi:hypothetical protein C5B89_13635 [Haloferax sp. Atlit-47N]|uniref:DUF7847 domain-containing protein n=2 Tax=Haloferax TaxID=2251 RepID=A0A847TQE6_HALVO|nr:hypothetical protein [Haloferax alexandrinus]RDZ30935.1 hypothetical protein DEQ67_12075 [Haloferax sp. Atlit-48N]RDZ38433.1 hypothetical protein C5B89_13635 [Haloferax sp. Atlit-47N]